MNQIKRITAFLLTFIMCLQVMVFSAFATEIDLDFDIAINDDFNEFMDITSMLALKKSYPFKEIDTDDKNTTTFAATDNDFIVISYTINNKTNNLKEICLYAIKPEQRTTTQQENFTTLLLMIASHIDKDLDTEVFLDNMEGKGAFFSLNNVTYMKVKQKDTLVILMKPNDEYYNKKESEEKQEEIQQPQQEEKTQSNTQTKQSEQQTQSTPQPQNNTISVVIDGQALVTNVAPQSINGRTMVPMRSIFEALGATVTWNADTKQAVATKGNKKVTLTLNSATAYINGEAKTLEAPAISYNGSTLVPARFVAEAFGATVTWDNATKTVNIISEVKPVETTPAPAQPEEPKTEPEPEPEQTTTTKQTAEEKPQQTAPQGNTVYVTKTGKKYHYDDSCNGGTYYASTLEAAKSRGLTACDKCA